MAARRGQLYRSALSGLLGIVLSASLVSCIANSETQNDNHAVMPNSVCESVHPYVERMKDPFRTGSSELFGNSADVSGTPDLYLSSWLYSLANLHAEHRAMIEPREPELRKFFRRVLEDPRQVSAAATGLSVMQRLHLAAQGYSLASDERPVQVDHLEQLRKKGMYRFAPEVEPDIAATSLAVSIQEQTGLETPAAVIEQIKLALGEISTISDPREIALRGEPILTAAEALIGSGALENISRGELAAQASSWATQIAKDPVGAGQIGTVKRLLDVVTGLGAEPPELELQLDGVTKLPSGFYSIDGGRSADPQTTYYLHALGASDHLTAESLAVGLMPQGWIRLAPPTLQSTYYGALISHYCGVPSDLTEALQGLNQHDNPAQALSTPADLMMACQMSEWNSGVLEEAVDAQLTERIAELAGEASVNTHASVLGHIWMAAQRCDADLPEGHFKELLGSITQYESDADRAAMLYLDSFFEADIASRPIEIDSSTVWGAMWTGLFGGGDGGAVSIKAFERSSLYAINTSEGAPVTLGSIAAAVQWSIGSADYAIGFAPQ